MADWEPVFPPPAEPPPAPRPEAASRTLRFTIFAVAFVVIASVVAGVAWYLGGSGSNSAPDRAAGGIGPPPGQAIDAYIADRKAALAAIDEADRRVAVVTFTRYRSEADAQAAIDRVLSPGSVEVLARLVAVGGDQPQVVTGSLAEWASGYRAKVTADRAEIERLLPTVEPGSDWDRFYRDELVRLDAVLTGADPAAPLVFAVAVRGPVRALRALAETSTVRLVDAGPSGDPSSGDVYRAPMPDETATIGDPQRRPVAVR